MPPYTIFSLDQFGVFITDEKLSIGKFYCGPGGLGLGTKIAKIKNEYNEEISYKHIFATDYDQDTCDTLLFNYYLEAILDLRSSISIEA